MGEMLDLGNRRQVYDVEDLICCFPLGIYHHGNAQIILHLSDLLSVVGVSHPGDGVFGTHLLGNKAGKDVQLIAAGQSDHQLRIRHICLVLNIHTCAVAHDPKHIVLFNQLFDAVFVFVDDGNGVPLAGKVL